MGIVTIDARDKTPIYAQLERALRAAIAPGRLTIGDQLPTVRQLAVDLKVNANTVARVYAELERAGVHRDPARRRLVRQRHARAGAHRRASTSGGCARSRRASSPSRRRRVHRRRGGRRARAHISREDVMAHIVVASGREDFARCGTARERRRGRDPRRGAGDRRRRSALTAQPDPVWWSPRSSAWC